MPRIYTLSDISEGNKLGGIPSSRYPPNRIELENQLACANRDRKIAIECGNQLVNKCSVLDKDNKRIQRDLKQSNKDKEELSKHTYQLIEEVRRLSSELDSLISKITRKDISLNESKIKIKDLQSRIKILETELSSTQNESKEITSLRSMKKILEDSELESKVNELERLKSEAKSKPVESESHCSAIIGGDDEKNTLCEKQSSMTKSDDISAVIEPSKDLSQYFLCRKKMDSIEKIDDGITEPSKVDTEISSKINEETNINEISKDILLVQEIKNVTPHLAQPENHTSSLIESHPQISVGGIEAILAVASTLMSPLSAYICLILLIIAVIWFVVLRRTWGFDRKNERLRDMWIGH
ncbi:17018_t:CDS:2 [Entrophospora sp. SA101]|nr:17018_t:CDS:2 [Entrophospora sp. SA101]